MEHASIFRRIVKDDIGRRIYCTVSDGLDRDVAEVEAPDNVSDLAREVEDASCEVWSLRSR